MNIEISDKQQVELWPKIVDSTSTAGMLHTTLRHVARNLTKMVGRPIEINSLDIETVSLNSLDALTDDPEAEAVGIYLLLTDEELSGEAILILQPDDAMYLVDWLLEERPGTTTKLDTLAYSALSEFGNQTLSSFLNAVADFTGFSLRLSPPTVVVDMLAVILEAVALSAATVQDLAPGIGLGCGGVLTTSPLSRCMTARWVSITVSRKAQAKRRRSSPLPQNSTPILRNNSSSAGWIRSMRPLARISRNTSMVATCSPCRCSYSSSDSPWERYQTSPSRHWCLQVSQIV